MAGYDDTTPDPFADLVAVDLDGDGTYDAVLDLGDPTADPLDPAADLTPDGTGFDVPSLTDPVLDGDLTAPTLAEPLAFDPGWVAGLPEDAAYEAQWWQQQTENGFCGPTSVAMVVSEFVGHPVDAGVFVESAQQLGLMSGEPGAWEGMRIDEIDDLLEAYGVPTTEHHFETRDDAEAALQQALDRGSGVIALVDSTEIWKQVDDDWVPGSDAIDHAVVVADMDDTYVYVNDPGVPDGDAVPYPKEAFFDAWSDNTSGNPAEPARYGALVTDVAPGEAAVTPWADAARVVHEGTEPQHAPLNLSDLFDATREVDLSVQPAIPFDQQIADSGEPVWLLPLKLSFEKYGIDIPGFTG